MAPAPPPAPAPAINVYKKIAVIRHKEDTLNYEDVEGNVKTVSVKELGDALATATPLVAPKLKLDIPVPHITTVQTYKKDVSPTYTLPRSYVRYHRMSQQDWNNTLEYVADKEDETWLTNNAKFGGGINNNEKSGEALIQHRSPQVSLGMLEQMLDLMEKATGFETIITFHQAENLILSKIPQLTQLFPHKAPRPGATTLRHVLQDCYSYWVQKRSKLKRPLLRRFWPVTSTDDTNPHLVFRPREKEKYKLRKKRQNDMDAYQKLKQLRTDFDNLKATLDLVRRREELARVHLQLQVDLFQQRLHEIVDSSGLYRISNSSREHVKRILDIPTHYDLQPGGRKPKRIRPLNDTTSTTITSMVDSGFAPREARRKGAGEAPNRNVAGRNNGEPAPLFLHPLLTRETYTTRWTGHTPHVTTYVDSHPEPTFRYRHRPRIGRGGRVCIDRVPQPVTQSDITVYMAGRGSVYSTDAKARLLDLLPRPLDRAALSQKIEQMAVAAIKEDYENQVGAGGDPEENDGDEVLVKVKDWLETDDQIWGEERFTLGPV